MTCCLITTLVWMDYSFTWGERAPDRYDYPTLACCVLHGGPDREAPVGCRDRWDRDGDLDVDLRDLAKAIVELR